ncbi:MAG: DEAD/DEAH box helicase [Bdellovibrionaceae bacterium]|nr:DEAD/DEAH box helicase [Pseudobdellovibrionaceae bacterium]
MSKPKAESTPSIETFADLNLSEELLSSLVKMGYEKPTPIQTACVPVLLDSATDVVALARTGTGKTAAFGIPLIERLDAGKKSIQALVLCPTRELCVQVSKSLTEIGAGKRVRVLSIYGGDSYRRQRDGLARSPHIVVATPGRLIDLLDQGEVPLKSVQTIVLDEADEMISVGFKDALDQILRTMEGEDHRTWLFSATMSREVKRVQENFLPKAKLIDARGGEEKPRIRQQYMLTFEEDRFEALKRYLLIHSDFYGLIFCQTKAEVVALEEELKRDGFKVASLHGDKVQRDRESVFAAWKKHEVSIVVATDVAARGLDVQGLTHVVNMSLSREFETYVHRIGRTGRAGREGIALTFVWPKRMALLKQLESRIGEKLEFVHVPDAAEVSRAVLSRELLALLTPEPSFDEGNAFHRAVKQSLAGSPILDLTSADEIIAILARMIENKAPQVLDRPYVKMLSAESAAGRGGSSFGGRPSAGGRPSGRHPYHGKRDQRPSSGGGPRFGVRRGGDEAASSDSRPSAARSAGGRAGGKPVGGPAKKRFDRPERAAAGRKDDGQGGSHPFRRDRGSKRDSHQNR